MTILKLDWGSQRVDVPGCVHFPTDICSVLQEGEITVEKCAHRGTSACREHHRLSFGQNKHGHNNSAPPKTLLILLPLEHQMYAMVKIGQLMQMLGCKKLMVHDCEKKKR